MAVKYKGDPINFFYTDNKHLSHIVLGQENLGKSNIYFIKGKRNRFATLKGKITSENFESQLDSLISGNMRFQKILAESIFKFPETKK